MDTSMADELLAKGGLAAQAARLFLGPLRWGIEEWREFTEKVKKVAHLRVATGGPTLDVRTARTQDDVLTLSSGGCSQRRASSCASGGVH